MDMQDPNQREEYLRAHTGTEYHPCGTAALAQVVDEQLKVFGVQRLRVVDASIIPLHVSGNTGALVYAIAEKVADLIKSDQQGYRQFEWHRIVPVVRSVTQVLKMIHVAEPCCAAAALIPPSLFKIWKTFC